MQHKQAYKHLAPSTTKPKATGPDKEAMATDTANLDTDSSQGIMAALGEEIAAAAKRAATAKRAVKYAQRKLKESESNNEVEITESESNNKVEVTILPPIKNTADLETAFKELQPELLKHARRYTTKDRETAETPEDILQQVALRATQFVQGEKHTISSKRLGLSEQQIEQAKKTGKITPTIKQTEIAKPEGWLHTIIHNTGCNYCISRRRLLELQRRAKKRVEENEPFDDPEYKTIYDEKNRQLHEIIDRLPRKFERTINLYFFEGYSLKEIAAELNCCVNTVKSYKRRGQKLIGKELSKLKELEDGELGIKRPNPAA